MQYKQLGRSGLRVSEFALGTWVFGPRGNADKADCARIIHRALDAGINLVNTANVYQGGESERTIGEAIGGWRHEIVLATKVFGRVGPGPNDGGLSRKHIMQAVDDSLKRLQTEHIDLYQVHGYDSNTPLAETLATLTDLVRGGKVRYIGSSNFSAAQLTEAHLLAEAHGFERFISEQPPLSIFDRRSEREILPTCQRLGVGAISWSPLNFGWLSGKYRRGAEIDPLSRAATRRTPIHDPESAEGERKLDLVDQLLPLAAESGVTLSQYAIAWVAGQPGITAPILGPRTYEQLEDNLGAAGLVIPAEHRARIDELVAPGTRIGDSMG